MSDGRTSGLDGARLQAPLARLLRPLVRLLIRSGISFPALTDLLRELYVNVAEYDFALADRAQTDSRVSLLTGIHRKEVRRLRGAGAPISAMPAGLSRTSRILARWFAAPGYSGPDGRALPLPRTAPDGAPSFEALVASVTKDVRSRAVMDEWLDRGLVRLEDDRLVLVEGAVIPTEGDDGQLYYLGRNLHDHIAAAVANVERPSPRFLERAVHYDGLTEATAGALEARSRTVAMDALLAMNREAHTACEAAEARPDGTATDWRWNFGVYVYAERQPPAHAVAQPRAEQGREPGAELNEATA